MLKYLKMVNTWLGVSQGGIRTWVSHDASGSSFTDMHANGLVRFWIIER